MKYTKFSIAIVTCILLISSFGIAGISNTQQSIEIATSLSDTYNLPPPDYMDMSIDEAIQRRTSIREFSDKSVSDTELSTVLWSAYGKRVDGSRTIPAVRGNLGVVVYVLKEDAVYRYDSHNHSLTLYKNGDFRYIGQYTAPIQLGLVWDTSLNDNENIVGAQIGEIGQNIYLSCIALGLGTVTTGDVPSPLDEIGLPEDQVGKIVMPVGHPAMETQYVLLPMWLSPLPKVRDAGVPLSNVLENWCHTSVFDEEMTIDNISQMIWACYGYSYYLDTSGFETHFIERHRTVPSGHAYYPLQMYVVTSSGIFRYIPGLYRFDSFGLPIVTFLWKIKNGDFREDVANYSKEFVANAPMTIIIVLNILKTNRWEDLSSPELQWAWFYEAGACAQNVFLDSTAWGLSANIATVTNNDELNNLLNLNDECLPLFVVPIGKHK